MSSVTISFSSSVPFGSSSSVFSRVSSFSAQSFRSVAVRANSDGIWGRRRTAFLPGIRMMWVGLPLPFPLRALTCRRAPLVALALGYVLD